MAPAPMIAIFLDFLLALQRQRIFVIAAAVFPYNIIVFVFVAFVNLMWL